MENLNYHHLFYFWTTCQEGSFTKAAHKLRLSQSAISEQVSRLEEVLGHKLIQRTTRSFELTEMGVVVLSYADTIFATGKELINFVKNRPELTRQIIRMGAVGSLSRNLQAKFLAPLLDREDVQFTVIIGDFKRLTRLLRDHALDTFLSTSVATEDENGEFYTHLLTESPICLVAAKDRRTKKQTPEDILAERRVFLPSRTMESRADFDHFVEANKIQLNVAAEVDDIALLRVLALTGKGVVVVPKIGVAGDLENGSLVVLHEFKKIKQRYYAITRQKKFPNPIIGELIHQFNQ